VVLATLFSRSDHLQLHPLPNPHLSTPRVQTSRVQKPPIHETKTRDEEEVAQEAEEEEPVAAECARTGPSMAERLAASSPLMANYRPMLPPSSPDTPSLPKALHHSRHNLVRKDAGFPSPQLPTLPLVLITILTTVTTNVPSAQAKFFATQKSGHATLAGLSSTCLA
jgi:hypothetical protein